MKTEGGGNVLRMEDYDEPAREAMKQKRPAEDMLHSELSARVDGTPPAKVINMPYRQRIGKEIPRTAFGTRERGAFIPQKSVPQQVHESLAEEMVFEIQALTRQIERRGIPDGPKILSVVFREGSSNPERLSFLYALQTGIKQFSPELVRALEALPAKGMVAIQELQEPSGLATDQKYARIVVDFHVPDVLPSHWTGHLTEEPDVEGEGSLNGVLHALVDDQRRKMQAGKPAIVEKAGAWLRHFFRESND